MVWAARSSPHYVAAVRSRLIALTIVAAVTIAACGSDDDTAETAPTTEAATETTDVAAETTDAPEETTPETTGAASQTTEPAVAELPAFEPGPYDVGVQTITINADSDRPLTVEVWFPVTDGTTAPAYEYTLLPGAFYESPFAIDAAPAAIATDGPFPLVVFSHGSPAVRILYTNFAEAIASAGYVVAAPDHTGNTVFDLFAGTTTDRETNAFNRPLDVQAVITAMTDPASTETAAFVGSVDPDAIAVAGQSAGGYTAYATVAGHTNEIGTVERDERVDAIITLAPSSGGISDDEFATIRQPALVIAGTADDTTPIEPNVTRPWELSASSPHHRVDLIDGEHQSFTDFCEFAAFFPTMETPPPDLIVDTVDDFGAESCAPDVMPSERAHDLTNTFTVAFLDSVFRDGEMIDPDTTKSPDDVIFMTH